VPLRKLFDAEGECPGSILQPIGIGGSLLGDGLEKRLA
jgi:hypothetical protein